MKVYVIGMSHLGTTCMSALMAKLHSEKIDMVIIESEMPISGSLIEKIDKTMSIKASPILDFVPPSIVPEKVLRYEAKQKVKAGWRNPYKK